MKGWIPGLCLLFFLVPWTHANPPVALPAAPGNSVVLGVPYVPGPTSHPVEEYLPTSAHPGCVTCETCECSACCEEQRPRRCLESDHAFSGFIGPISNPILSKDPRALTEARFLFVHNDIPTEHPLGGGSFQVYALQVRVALTERLSLIADKDGYAVLQPGGAPRSDGFLNVAAGLKYALIRDVQNQMLFTAGFMYEPQSGDADVFQNQGDGVFSIFGTFGKEFAGGVHFLGNVGYQFPVDTAENSSFYYASLHLDKQFFGCLYPLVELNWLHWVQGGRRGLPPALGEGDGLLNLGTTGVAGNDLVTVALGLKTRLGRHFDVGAAWEFPISNREDLIDHRVLFEAILRY